MEKNPQDEVAAHAEQIAGAIHSKLSDGNTSSPEAVNKELPVAIEARLIEQEHRFLRVLWLFIHRKDWPEDDPRRKAVLRALLWQFLSKGTVVTGGTMVALLTIVLTYWQVLLIREQNQEFQRQTAAITNQTSLTELRDRTTRRTQLIEALYEIDATSQPERAKFNARTRSEAFAEFLSIERLRLGTNPPPNLSHARLDNIFLFDTNLARTVFTGADLQNAQLSGASFMDCMLLEARLSGATMKDTDLRRAILMRATGTNVNLANARMERAVLAFAKFAKANLSGVKLGNAQLQYVQMTDCHLDGASLENADMRGASLDGVSLVGANLQGISNWMTIRSVTNANLFAITNAPTGFLDWALTNGAVVQKPVNTEEVTREVIGVLERWIKRQ